MKRRILALALAGLMAFTAIGCSTKSTEKSKSGTTGDKSGGEVNILTEWAFSDDVIKKFESETGISVKQNVVLNSQNMQQVRNSKLASGENLDIMGINNDTSDPSDFVKKGYLIDLSNEEWLNNFNPQMLTDMQKQCTMTPDKTYLVSYEAIYMGVWYNKDMFSKYNIAVPKNWNEFLATCDTLKKNGVTPLVQGGKDSWPLDQEMKFAREALLDENKTFKTDIYTGKVKWTDPDVVSKFERIGKLLNPKNGYYVSGMLGTAYDQCYQLLLQKKAAMWLMGSWAVETMVKSNVTPDFTLGVFPLPNNDPSKQQYSYGQTYARPYGIYSKSKNVDNAKAFLKFMSKAENMTMQANDTMVIPTVKDCNANKVPAFSDWQSIMNLSSGGNTDQDMSAGHDWGPELQKIWWSELAKVASGEETTQQYCAALQTAQNKDSAAK